MIWSGAFGGRSVYHRSQERRNSSRAVVLPPVYWIFRLFFRGGLSVLSSDVRLDGRAERRSAMEKSDGSTSEDFSTARHELRMGANGQTTDADTASSGRRVARVDV